MAPTFLECSDDEAYFQEHGKMRPDPFFVDLNALQDSRWEEFAASLGIRTLSQMTGTEQIIYEDQTLVINPRTGERIKIDPKPPWNEAMANWQDPQIGLDYVYAMRGARASWWCDARDIKALDETLDTLEQALREAAKRGAKFRLC